MLDPRGGAMIGRGVAGDARMAAEAAREQLAVQVREQHRAQEIQVALSVLQDSAAPSVSHDLRAAANVYLLGVLGAVASDAELDDVRVSDDGAVSSEGV